jgi:ankyrin repeat protein
MGPKKPAKKKKGGGVKVSSQTPIFGSIEDGDKEEFEECLSQTPDCVHSTNKNGWTPLHQAAFSGELEMLHALLKAGAKINEMDHDGDTPVHYAAVQGELACVEALAKAGAKLEVKDNDGETPLDVAHKSVKKRLKELVESADAANDAADAVAAVKL